MKFNKERKGYDKNEVDKHVKSTNATILTQKERILEQDKKIASLESELISYRQRQELIAKSIMNAIQKAEQIENITRQKYSNDLAHLKAFHERWLLFYNKIMQKYPLTDDLDALGEFNKNMTSILMGDADEREKVGEIEAHFEKEQQRLKVIKMHGSEEKEFNPEESIRKLLRRQVVEDEQKKIKQRELKKEEKVLETLNIPQKDSFIEPGESSGFSYEECLNPTQELSDILKDLGLDIAE
ncbi:MAG: hypothetical protein FWE03_01805 [Firmicutes bacterium]|nr:hypothetical protein [Bacillota bacterium]